MNIDANINILDAYLNVCECKIKNNIHPTEEERQKERKRKSWRVIHKNNSVLHTLTPSVLLRESTEYELLL